MSKKILGFLILVLLGTNLGCTSFPEKTIKDTPTIKTEMIKMPSLSKVPKKQVALSVTDERAPEFRENSAAVTNELQRAVTVLLQNQGLTVQPRASNTLAISVQDHKSGGLQKGCVRLNGTITLETKSKVATAANSCIEYSPSIGDRRRTDISQAYEEALQLLFNSMDSELQRF